MSSNTIDGGLCVGINALRARSGGAVNHVVSLLAHVEEPPENVERIIVWTNQLIADKLQSYHWLTVIVPPVTKRTLLEQLVWEATSLAASLKSMGCDVVFNVDAGSLNRFRPSVTMSQDMLPFESKEAHRFGWSRQRFRLLALRFVSKQAFRHADAAIFLTEYARRIIGVSADVRCRTSVIPHGIDSVFRHQSKLGANHKSDRKSIIYISEISPYKHQCEVIRAFAHLVNSGCDVSLTLVGGSGNDAYAAGVREEIRNTGLAPSAIELLPFVDHGYIPEMLAEADIFLFASSCESLPITLLEAMAVGMPIASSNRGPMPEIGQQAFLYFDPEDPVSIASCIGQLVSDPDLCERLAIASKDLSTRYTWVQCAKETLDLITSVARNEDERTR